MTRKCCAFEALGIPEVNGGGDDKMSPIRSVAEVLSNAAMGFVHMTFTPVTTGSNIDDHEDR